MKKVKTMTDREGREIPANRVTPFERLCDRNVRRIHARHVKARLMLEEVIAADIKDIAEMRDLKDAHGVKGNFQAQSFDGLLQVVLRQRYNVVLDERSAKARDLMLDYTNGVLDRVTGVDTTVLRRLVEAAFRANSQGFLPVAKILDLMRMEVKDARWNEARGLLQDSLRPVKGKQYFHAESRSSVQDDWHSVCLDAADCWPKSAAEAEEDVAK